MASPWKLLARLMSPRHKRHQEQSSTDDVKLVASAVATPTKAAEIEGDYLALDKKPVLHNQSKMVLAHPDQAEEETTRVQVAVDIEAANLVETADSALADTAAREVAKPFKSRKRAEARRGRLGKNPDDDTSPVSQTASTAPTDALSLDDEIRLLRKQLAGRIKLQNTQLKKMLERFGP